MEPTTPMPPPGGPPTPSLRPWALTCVLATVAGVLVWAFATQPSTGPARSLPLGVVAALVLAGRRMQTPFHLKRQTITISLGNCATVLAIVFLPRTDVLPLVGAAVGLHQLWRRASPLKAIFNVANNLVAAGVATLALDVVLGAAPITGDRGWAAITVAAFAHDALSTVVLVLVVNLRGGFDRRRLVVYLTPMAVATGVNIALSIVAIDTLWTNRLALAFLVAVPVGAVAGHRAYTRLAARFSQLEALYGLTQRLAGLSEEHDVLREVLVGLEQALSCGRAQLVVQGHSTVLSYELDGAGVMGVRQLPGIPALLELMGAERDALLAPRGARGPIGQALAAGGFDDAMLTRLPSETGDERILVVADRHGSGSFTRTDLPFLETLAAQCAVSLRGTRLLDELRTEVASREYDALHDSLTLLGNRELFARRTDEALARRRPNGVVAVMLMDLDGFKEINDTLGHHVGDLVLQEVARRLAAQAGGRGLPTRLGGDEFAIVFPVVGPTADVRDVAQGLCDAVSRPMEVGDLALTVQSSIGIALAPGHGTDTSSLLKGADVAMYVAKASSDRISVYDPSGDHHSTRRLLLASELRLAADAAQLVLHYQPKADLRSGAVLGFEALLRWTHPAFGEVSPSEFIPVAEQCGLIDGMTWWVLGEALQQQRRWAEAGHDLSVAVNISARSLLDGRLATRLSDLLTASGVAPERLILEVTETSVMADAERSAAILDAAAALGVQISVDDFGTGYSSLSRLLEMPVHEIKVDRSFVTTMLQSGDNMAIVSSTVHLALSMGRRVTAEGVEDEETWARLRDIGCHAAQGYVLARPMLAERTLPWLAGRDRVGGPTSVVRALSGGVGAEVAAG